VGVVLVGMVLRGLAKVVLAVVIHDCVGVVLAGVMNMVWAVLHIAREGIQEPLVVVDPPVVEEALLVPYSPVDKVPLVVVVLGPPVLRSPVVVVPVVVLVP